LGPVEGLLLGPVEGLLLGPVEGLLFAHSSKQLILRLPE
jgi:hypothetical protein